MAKKRAIYNADQFRKELSRLITKHAKDKQGFIAAVEKLHRKGIADIVRQLSTMEFMEVKNGNGTDE